MIGKADLSPAETAVKFGMKVFDVMLQHEPFCDVGNITFLAALSAHLTAGFTGIHTDDEVPFLV